VLPRKESAFEVAAQAAKKLDDFTAYDAAKLVKLEQDRLDLAHVEYVRSVIALIKNKAGLGKKECELIVEDVHAQATLNALLSRSFKVDRDNGAAGWIIGWDLPVIPQPAGGR
jgi:hypothetical protein